MAQIKWQCSWCGASTATGESFRPNPGFCSKKGKTKDGKYKPHTWKKVKKF
jgi:hypothetical protein